MARPEGESLTTEQPKSEARRARGRGSWGRDVPLAPVRGYVGAL